MGLSQGLAAEKAEAPEEKKEIISYQKDLYEEDDSLKVQENMRSPHRVVNLKKVQGAVLEELLKDTEKLDSTTKTEKK